jgi:hypothetical protein
MRTVPPLPEISGAGRAGVILCGALEAVALAG